MSQTNAVEIKEVSKITKYYIQTVSLFLCEAN